MSALDQETPMRRIVVLGASGGGKSTLARHTALALGLPLFSMDKICLHNGWRVRPREEMDRFIEQLLVTDAWVLDGPGIGWSMLRAQCQAADTLILIDHPAWRHYWWAYKRNFKLLFTREPDLPDGCSKWPLWKTIPGTIRHSRRAQLPNFTQMLADWPDKAQFILRSPQDILMFCQRHLNRGQRSAAAPVKPSAMEFTSKIE
jgi:adenylate kinase family enzyme